MKSSESRIWAESAEGARDLVLDVLECVRLLKGGYGRHTVASVLMGSRRENILRDGLAELKVYGTHRDLDRRSLVALLDRLGKQGAVAYRGGAFPACVLTERGERILIANGVCLPSGPGRKSMGTEDDLCRRAPAPAAV